MPHTLAIGGEVGLGVWRQELVRLCQLALAKLIKFVAADDKTKTTPTI